MTKNDVLIENFLPKTHTTTIKKIYSYSGKLILSGVNLNVVDKNIKKDDNGVWAKTFLLPHEYGRFQNFTFSKRKAEWLGGRIAAKYAGNRLLQGRGSLKKTNYWHELQVCQDEHGKPFLEIMSGHDQAPPPDISISHSAGYAFALATERPCGMDLQNITPRIITIQDRYMNEDEKRVIDQLNQISGLQEIAGLTLLWAAKEAVRKLHAIQPLPSFRNITLRKFSGSFQDGFCLHLKNQNTIKAFGFFKDDYAFAITLKTK